MRGWRSWWATHEMDRRNRPRRRGARGGVGGGFGNLKNFGGSRAAGVLTLLVLSLFTGAIALGAQSIAAAVIAFLFFAGALAVVTAARARYHFIQEPVETEVPLEKVAEFHIDDLKTEDEPADDEVNSLADLERSFAHDSEKDAESKAPSAAVSAKAAEVKAPSKDTVTVVVPQKQRDEAADDKADEPDAAAAGPVETAPAETESSEAASEPEPVAEAGLDEVKAETTESGPVATEAVVAEAPEDDPPIAAEVARETLLAQASARDTVPADPPRTTEPESEAPESDDLDDEDEDEEDSDASVEVPAPREPSDEDEPVALDDDFDDIDALMAPLFDEEDDPEPVPSQQSETPGTALSLLAAETPGTVAHYGGASSLPPEAVRDVAATLIVADLPRSVMFYTELLGLVEIDRAPDAVLLEAGFGRVLLWRRDDAPGAGDPVMHLTFEVGDIDAAYESMRAKGIEFIHPPRAALSGEVHNLRAASFLDPDGHGLAITELREHSSRRLIPCADKSELPAISRNSSALFADRFPDRLKACECAAEFCPSLSSADFSSPFRQIRFMRRAVKAKPGTRRGRARRGRRREWTSAASTH